MGLTNKYNKRQNTDDEYEDINPTSKKTKIQTPDNDNKSTNSESNITQQNNKQTHQNITALQWNICGMRSKTAEIQMILNNYNPKLIALQETLFNDEKYRAKLNGRKYKWYLKAGNSNKARNGVALAMAKSTPHQEIKLKTDLQAVACQTLGLPKITYVSIYIPPRKLTPKETNRKLQKLINEIPKPFILMGDFNAHHTEWGSYKIDRWGDKLLEFIRENNLIILNNGSYTKYTKNYESKSAIDLTICSWELAEKFHWEVDNDNRGSDHFPILISNSDNNETIDEGFKPNWQHDKADWEQFRALTSKYTKELVEPNLEELTNIIIKAANQTIPKTSAPKQGRKVPWWSDEVAKSIKARKKVLRKLHKMHPNDPNKDEIVRSMKQQQKETADKIKKAKKESWDEFIKSINRDCSSGELWKKVNSLSGKTYKDKITLISEDKELNHPQEVAEKLADHFYKQSATSEYSKEFQKIKQKEEANRIILNENNNIEYNNDFSLEELNFAIENSEGKAPGHDQISYDMIKHLPIDTKLVLLNVYNKVWKERKIPKEWKLGIVVPIPKGGEDKHSPNNYRPITLLSCVGKLMEKMVNRRLITELENKNRLNKNQLAFRQGKGTDDYFIQLESIINKPFEDGKHIDCALLDISKAYDRAWRYHILRTIKKWNISGNMALYIEDFLKERLFQVEIGNTRSKTRQQENGIPQGAILSVTLFLIGMNSIFEIKDRKTKIKFEILVYADDIVIIAIGMIKGKLRKLLQRKINIVNDWAKSIGFSIAPNKSKILHICQGFKHRINKVKLDNEEIPQVKSAKLLGITIDSRLTFKQHIIDLKKELINRCNLIKTISGRSGGTDRKTLIQIFEALVVSKILYGAHFYSRCQVKTLKPIATLYNQTIRIISGAFPTSPTLSILAEAGVMPIETKIKLNTINKAIKWLEKSNQANERDIPIYKRANQFLNELIGENIPNISKISRTGPREWNARRPKIDKTIKRKIKAGTSAKVVNATFNELMNKYKDHNKIYTDGSVADEQVGCGVTDLKTKYECTRLHKQCTIFSAEALALLTATYDIAQENEDSIIITDSASCLEAMDKGNTKHPWLQAVEDANYNKNITYCWVPGHAGITGNIEADKLADKGRTANELCTEVPAMDAINWIKKMVIWNNDYKWFKDRTTFLRKIKNNSLPGKDRKNTREQKILTRVRIGHTWLTHKYLLDKIEQPRCLTCNTNLTADHIIRECRIYDTIRNKYEITDMSIYYNTRESEDKLIAFLAETELLHKL